MVPLTVDFMFTFLFSFLLFGLDDAALALILSGVIAAAGSAASVVYTNKQNRDLHQSDLDWQESMVNKQNEYNTLSNQVDRAQSAGVNPVAATMSNGLSVGNTSASPGTPSAIPMLDLMQSLSGNSNLLSSAYKSLAEGKTTSSLRKFQIQNIQAQTAQYMANVQKLGVDTKGQLIANEYAAALNEVEILGKKSVVDLNYAQISNLNALTKKSVYELENVLPQSVKESVSRTKLNVWQQDLVVAEIERCFAETSNIKSETELNEARLDTEGLVQQNIAVDTERVSSETQSLDQQIQLFLDTYDSQVEKISNETKLSKKQVRWFIVNSILHGAQSAAVTGASAVGAAKMVSSMGRAVSVAGF